MAQLGDVQSHVELCSRVSVEEYVVTHLESYIVLIAYSLLVCYNALVMVVMLKLVKAVFVVSHARLLEDLEHLDKTIMVLSRKLSRSSKSLDSPQEQPIFQPNKVKLLCISANSCCEHSNVLEENIIQEQIWKKDLHF